jgi:outer membrane receptor protein involved in Fe transport
VQTAFGSAGSFFERSILRGRRVQGITDMVFPRVRWHGTHEFKVGVDEDAVRFDGTIHRNPLLLLRSDGTLASRATFTNPPQFAQDNFQSALYAQDRWSPADRMIVEYGVRGDWDQIIREFVPSRSRSREPVPTRISPRTASHPWVRRW